MDNEKRLEQAKAKPEHTIKFRDSQAYIYDFGGIIQDAALGVVKLYDRSDFPSPVYRATARAQQLEFVPSRERCTAYTGEIQVDPLAQISLSEVQEYLHRRLATYSGKLTEGGLEISGSQFGNCFLVADKHGNRCMIWIDTPNNRIVVSNNLALTSVGDENKTTVTVVPKPDHTVDPLRSFSTFLQSFMYGADLGFSSKKGYLLSGYSPDQLRREYHIGRSRDVTTLPTTPPSSAASSEKKQSRVEKEEKIDPSELGVEVLESDVSFEDIGGLRRVKMQMQEAASSFKHPEIMDKWDAKRIRGILLYGPPGTGKTMLCLALARELGAVIWRIGPETTARMWHGESESNMKKIFGLARGAKQPLILFFDEFETVIINPVETGTGGASEARRGVASVFKTELNTIFEKNPNVFILGATNYPERIDESLIRAGRFDYKIRVPMPDMEGRLEIISKIILGSAEKEARTGFKIYASDIETLALATAADGLSGSDIDSVFRTIKTRKAMRMARGEQVDPITQQELWDGVSLFKRRS